MTGVYLGVDIGGTNIKFVTVSAGGRVLRRAMIESRSGDGPDAAFRRIGAAAGGLLGRGQRLAGAGIGCAGTVDARRGRVLSSPNLPAWRNARIADLAKRYLKVPPVVDNDANAAAYGEYRRGVGRGARMLICITLGTGVGGGAVVEGRVLRGARNFAGEIGHMTISEDGPRCKCGNRGCLEAYVGAYAIVANARRRLRRKTGRLLSRWLEKPGTRLTPRLIAEAARRRDAVAREVLIEAAGHLGTACASLVNIFNPDVIAVAGGVAGAFDLMKPVLERVVRARAFGESAEIVRITRGALGNDAAAIGAALFVRDRLAAEPPRMVRIAR